MDINSSVKGVILYDGTCVLCDRFVNFIKKSDKKGKFRFEAYQGSYGEKYLHLMTLNEYGSVGLLFEGKLFVKSEAALQILRILGFPWSICYLFIIIPKGIRDGIYQWVAKNRYFIFGKKEYCEIS